MTHTPGPWGVADAGQFIIVEGGPRNDDIASFFYRDEATVKISREAALANAALCAATPEMLAALKAARATIIAAIDQAVHLPDWDPAEHRVIKLIDAAIAKATGEAA
jgi:hypothetical protein